MSIKDINIFAEINYEKALALNNAGLGFMKDKLKVMPG
jgi:hypothetical protein